MMRQAGVESVRAEVPCAGSARKNPLAQRAAEHEMMRSLIVCTWWSGPEWKCTRGKVGVPGRVAV